MSSATDSALDDPFWPVRKTLALVRESFLLSLVGLGIVLLILGKFVLGGVVAGMFGIWSISLILTCSIGYAVIMYKKSS